MKKQKNDRKNHIVNHRAHFDYIVDETFVAGMQLSGPEVRATRDNKLQIDGSYVTIKDNEVWLINASFTVSDTSTDNFNKKMIDRRNIKLLLKKSQISRLLSKKEQGFTIIPLSVLNDRRYIKIDIATAKGKKQYDKRNTKKLRDQERDVARQLDRRMRL
jgi:SsrA-binding protein